MNAFSAHLHQIRRFLSGRIRRAEQGASLMEYAVLVAVMAGVVLVTVTLLGARITTFIDSLNFLA